EVTGNTFHNIAVPDGAIAFQTFSGGATFDRLSSITIDNNSFTGATPAEPIFVSDGFFGPGAVLPDSIAEGRLIIGTNGNDVIIDTVDADIPNDSDTYIAAGGGDDTITGGAGNDTIDGGEGGEINGDVVVYAAALAAENIVYDAINDVWTVTTTGEGVD